MGRLREEVSVVCTTPVDGTPRRRERGPDRQPRSSRVDHVQAPPELMRAARRALRPGQRLVVVSATEVRIVNA